MNASPYEALTPAQAERRGRETTRRLLQAIDEHGQACEEEAEALATYNETYLTAHLLSMDEHLDRKVAHHETAAQATAAGAKRTLVFATSKRRSLGEEMHSLRSVLSWLQTNTKAMAAVS